MTAPDTLRPPAPGAGGLAAWQDLLATMEAALTGAEDVLAAGGVPAPLPDPAGDVAPLPRELSGRAKEVLRRTRLVEHALAAARARTAIELEELRRSGEPSTSQYLDTRA